MPELEGIYGLAGWQGILTLLVARWVYKDVRSWWRHRNGKNPGPKYYDEVLALRAEVQEFRDDFSLLAQRVSKIEGHLDL